MFLLCDAVWLSEVVGEIGQSGLAVVECVGEVWSRVSR